jgi:hypothetical protein
MDLLINLDRGVCESIDLEEVSTFNVKKYIPYNFLGFFTTNILVYKTKLGFITIFLLE